MIYLCFQKLLQSFTRDRPHHASIILPYLHAFLQAQVGYAFDFPLLHDMRIRACHHEAIFSQILDWVIFCCLFIYRNGTKIKETSLTNRVPTWTGSSLYRAGCGTVCWQTVQQGDPSQYWFSHQNNHILIFLIISIFNIKFFEHGCFTQLVQ